VSVSDCPVGAEESAAIVRAVLPSIAAPFVPVIDAAPGAPAPELQP
jgi:hypothetical protein